MTRSTFVGSILGYVGGLGPHFCRGVPWSPDIVPYKTGEQPTTLNAQGDPYEKRAPSFFLTPCLGNLLKTSWACQHFAIFVEVKLWLSPHGS